MLEKPTKFIMDACFRLAAKKRFNVQLDHDIINEGYLIVDDERPLVRMGSFIDNFCNLIALKNFVHYICLIPTFSVFMRQGLKMCSILRSKSYLDFRPDDLFVEEIMSQ
jgi:hypothetical protein